ncbi:MAG: ankyrin repeat domain-containing protein [Armatimonadetes bacterium]|nr:ankyrin repeat domain-containing protein [Armatimonadota bacterium]
MVVRSTLIVAFVLLHAASAAVGAEIHAAAARGDSAKVKALISKNSKLINLPDKDGATPLHHAVAKGHDGLVKLLIDSKADVKARKKDGVTPLHIAAALGHKACAEALLDGGADVNATDAKGRTPLSIAREKGHTEMADFLVSRGARSSDPASSNGSAPPPHSDKKPVDLLMLSKDFVDLISAGSYQKAAEMFDPNMKSAMPSAKLGEVWQTVIQQAGRFKGQVGSRKTNLEGHDVVYVTCEFEKAKADLQIAFDAQNRIAGLYVVPPGGN